MVIRTLVDDKALEGYSCEHGLSFHITANGKNILFDLGKTNLFTQNAQHMGIDIAAVDFAVISHAHYDHGGGLRAFLQANDHALVYVRENAFGEFYARRPNRANGRKGQFDYIGLDKALRHNPRIIQTGDEYQIADGFSLFSKVTGKELFSPANIMLYKEYGGDRDDFTHEQNLLITEGDKRVLFVGCAHNGIINILSRCNEIDPQPLAAVIGGMHLTMPRSHGNILKALVDGIAEYLLTTSAVYYTGHCTGELEYERLHEIMGNRVHYLAAGSEITI
jgi:7,8-dihydropterin-6-yl-methyl-4-(beta-D-ribofuranosyl)aminobenzene 5'-phosphate synthase